MNAMPIANATNLARKPLVSALLLAIAGHAHALPQFINDKGAQVTVTTPKQGEMLVKQKDAVASANWKTFSIGANESVRFEQPDANAVVINRVLGQDPSQILGRMQANGRVFLINPNGIVFGVNSQVNVGALVASTLALKDKNNNDKDKPYEFKDENSAGIEVLGKIEAEQIALLAPTIQNKGTLIGPDIQLLAAGQVTAQLDKPFMVFKVKEGHEQAVIEQLGQLDAGEGMVTLLARSDGKGELSVLNTKGLTKAVGIVMKADKISLSGEVVGALQATANTLTADLSSGLVIGLNADTANLKATEISLGDSRIEGDFQASAAGLLSQNGKLEVGGSSKFEAEKFVQSGEAVFKGRAQFKVKDLELLSDNNRFEQLLELDTQRADIKAKGELTLSVNSETVSVEAGQVILQKANVAGDLQVKADALTQVDVVAVGGKARLDVRDVDLGNAQNTFGEGVDLIGVDRAKIAAFGNLTLSGQASLLDATASGFMALNMMSPVNEAALKADRIEFQNFDSLGALRVEARQLGQTNAVQWLGDARIQAQEVVLNHASNDFAGALDLDVQRISLADANTLLLGGQVRGDLNVLGGQVTLGKLTVDGESQIQAAMLNQTGDVAMNKTTINADTLVLDRIGNDFKSAVAVAADKATLADKNDLQLDATKVTGALALNTGGDATVLGDALVFESSRVAGNLLVNARSIAQTGALRVARQSSFTALGGDVQLMHAGNAFSGEVFMSADLTRLNNSRNLTLGRLSTRGGEIQSDGKLLLNGDVDHLAGTLVFTARGIPFALSSEQIAQLLPPVLDVFSSREVVDPFTGLGRVTVASAAIEQTRGRIASAAGAQVHFATPEGGSVVLGGTNQFNGGVSALAGQAHGEEYQYKPENGASLLAINSEAALRVDRNGVEADLVAIRARGLNTGTASVIRARMPYNDFSAGSSRSFPGLTLSLPLNTGRVGASQVLPFGEAGSGASAGAGAIRVEVGELNRPGFGGFVTVLPTEGAVQAPGQVVYLQGPQTSGGYSFFYDGARNLRRIPVSYNGALLLSPQENAAVISAQGAVVLARQEQTRSVVRTENVAGQVINGVVAEVGPGRPATLGQGEPARPASCDAAESSLSCAR